jgi:hypothetical protein
VIVTTYIRFVAKLTAGIQFCREYLGERLSGTVALFNGDLLAEGARQAIIARMPGHPEQAEDSLNQSGSDAGLFRYRGESFASWSARVANPWPNYEQCSTDIQILRAINEWGNIVFPDTWSDADLVLVEGPNATFTIFMLEGQTPWQPPWRWGDGSRWGQPKLMYGVTNAEPEDTDAIRRIVRKWKPARSKGQACIVISGHVWGEPGLRWGAFTYSPAGDAIVFTF